MVQLAVVSMWVVQTSVVSGTVLLVVMLSMWIIASWTLRACERFLLTSLFTYCRSYYASAPVLWVTEGVMFLSCPPVCACVCVFVAPRSHSPTGFSVVHDYDCDVSVL